MYSFILFTIFLALSFLYYFKINSNYWKKKNIKQAKGILWRWVTGAKSLPELLKEVYDAHPNLPHIGILLCRRPALILRDTQNIQAVLHGDFESFYARDIFTNATDILSDNLLFIDNINRWRLLRQKLSAVLTTRMLKSMFYITERCARDFVNLIEEEPNIIDDPYNAIYTYTAACIGSKVFGIDKETKSTMKTPLRDIAQQSQPIFKVKLSFFLTRISQKLYELLNMKISGAYENRFIKLIEKAMEKRRNSKENHHDFVDVYLKYEDQGVLKDCVTGYEVHVNLNFLAAQAFVFFVGGIDTISTVLHFTLLELSNNCEILKKAHDEIDKTFESDGGIITFEGIDKLEYIGMLLNESMRKYPPVGASHRKCCKDTILPVGNVTIETGKNVIIPIFALHRDHKYFPNPDVFDPERFSLKNKSKIAKYSFIPFGEGKRNCIGIRLAFMEMKTCLAWLLRKYTLKEQTYTPKRFDPSLFLLRDPKAHYEIIPRVQPCLPS